ncbi:SDR family NAD(P)-dependent oxidoreductase [Actinoplanes sp. NPDC049596]|uniref:SDR family NAD(P)-dependent oxidoreductase n=1 Tax=unclassified Actinoplanes TaxID=2626549 RepID=UPI0034426174
MNLQNRRGVITGAGSGIGRELAQAFAERGGALLLVGRRPEPLEETAEMVRTVGGEAHILATDVSAGNAAEHVVSSALAQLGELDLLVNNAGNVRAGRLEDTPEDDIRAMLALNLTAPILLTRAALPTLRRRTGSRPLVLTIASGMALTHLPFYSAYAASKAGVAAFGHSLRRELLDTDVHVATVYPGATATAMMATSDAGEELGFGTRTTAEVVADILTALAADEHEINTSLPSRRELQRLQAIDPLAVDAKLAPQLARLEAAVRNHSSM